MKNVLPVLAAVAMSACWLQDCAATTLVTREEMVARAERVAKWTALDGEWEGGLAIAWPPDGIASKPLYLRLGFSDKSVVVSTRDKESDTWTVIGTYTLTSLDNKERALITVDSTSARPPGRYLVSFLRDGENSATTMFSRKEKAPGNSPGFMFVDNSSGVLRRSTMPPADVPGRSPGQPSRVPRSHQKLPHIGGG